MSENDNKAALQLIQKDLALPAAEINKQHAPGLEDLHHYLSLAISELLDKDFNRLLNALYRIDINEKKVAETIHMEDPGQIAPGLATLIIERELEKVQTRKKYSGGNQN
jgi:hypothetical protein